ncbi:hypothetical protein KBJ98_02175 [Flavobacterium sp. F-328]|uniref:Uncharacterized protein n=1 Tax=Flavobacterium erciyesense TaxID=2825842 RepID=A0ABS5D0F9_9FLAO|nr:hypothetical protein [Flavobacterium erciyesense]MBQ0907503.1 hypothetical protein [Flavobacterium erciyesense]
MRNLRLTLKSHWFYLTKAEKTEDYREINQYWFKRLVYDYKKVFNYCTGYNWDDDYMRDEGIDHICKSKLKMFDFVPFYKNIMTLGYPKVGETSKIIELQHLGIEISTGKPEWGAEPDKLYFVIKHGPETV